MLKKMHTFLRLAGGGKLSSSGRAKLAKATDFLLEKLGLKLHGGEGLTGIEAYVWRHLEAGVGSKPTTGKRSWEAVSGEPREHFQILKKATGEVVELLCTGPLLIELLPPGWKILPPPEAGGPDAASVAELHGAGLEAKAVSEWASVVAEPRQESPKRPATEPPLEPPTAKRYPCDEPGPTCGASQGMACGGRPPQAPSLSWVLGRFQGNDLHEERAEASSGSRGAGGPESVGACVFPGSAALGRQ